MSKASFHDKARVGGRGRRNHFTTKKLRAQSRWAVRFDRQKPRPAKHRKPRRLEREATGMLVVWRP